MKMDSSSEMFLENWPSAGIMHSGIAFRPTQLGRHFGETELRLWPRPIASDGIAWKKTKKSDPMVSIWKCWKNGKQDRPIYYHIWNGLTPSQSADIVETMMGFPKGWTDLNA